MNETQSVTCRTCGAERTMLMDGTEVYRCGSEYNRGKVVHACYKPAVKAEAKAA